MQQVLNAHDGDMTPRPTGRSRSVGAIEFVMTGVNHHEIGLEVRYPIEQHGDRKTGDRRRADVDDLRSPAVRPTVGEHRFEKAGRCELAGIGETLDR